MDQSLSPTPPSAINPPVPAQPPNPLRRFLILSVVLTTVILAGIASFYLWQRGLIPRPKSLPAATPKIQTSRLPGNVSASSADVPESLFHPDQVLGPIQQITPTALVIKSKSYPVSATTEYQLYQPLPGRAFTLTPIDKNKLLPGMIAKEFIFGKVATTAATVIIVKPG